MSATDTRRFFYRCFECLSVAAADLAARYAPTMDCSCGGRMEPMGHVQRFRIVNAELHCPCDARCTGATGPNCECQCGGANHGSGRLVEIVRDAGPIPKLKAGDMERAAEYRAARDAAKARIEAKYADSIARRMRGAWVPSEAYWGLESDRQALQLARGLRTHKKRLDALARVCLHSTEGVRS